MNLKTILHTFHHYAVTCNGTEVWFYVDGNEVSHHHLNTRFRVEGSAAISSNSGGSSLVIGNTLDSNRIGYGFGGFLTDIMIFEKNIGITGVKNMAKRRGVMWSRNPRLPMKRRRDDDDDECILINDN